MAAVSKDASQGLISRGLAIRSLQISIVLAAAANLANGNIDLRFVLSLLP
ncbi:hypothetical protein [Mesorhizobium sp. M1405]